MYRLRFIRIMFWSLIGSPRHLQDEYSVSFWAIPLIDTDFSRFFTHTYALFMALARWNFVFKSEFRRLAVRNRWAPVTSAETLTYKKSIRAFSRVVVKTKLLCWDENRFYLEQTFYVRGQVYAQWLLEGLLRSAQGPLDPIEIFRTLGVERASPPFPDRVRLWVNSLR